jgi:hypothetical protein
MTFKEVLKHAGLVRIILGLTFGASAWLTILQTVTGQPRFSSPVQWMVDLFLAAIWAPTTIIENPFRSVLHGINNLFGCSLRLNPLWKPVFITHWVVVLAAARAVGENIDLAAGLKAGILTLPFVLIASLLAGLLPVPGTWLTQASLAAAPVLGTMLGVTLVAQLLLPAGKFRDGAMSGLLSATALMVVIAVVVASSISLFPLLSDSAGVIALACVTMLWGYSFLRVGASLANETRARAGLGILLGPIGAGIFFAVDAGIRQVT